MKLRRGSAAAFLIVAVASGTVWHTGTRAAQHAGAASTLLAVGELGDPEIRDRDIEFYAARAERDPESALDRAQLAALYLQRGRGSGDPHDAILAESAARASLALRQSHNMPTVALLIEALLEQHRFLEARALAETLQRYDPDGLAYRAGLAEIQLELGDYEAAARSFRFVRRARSALPVAPRLARWEEIQGRDNVARELLEGARDSAMKRSDLPRAQVAWFHLKVGEHQLRRGRVREAERSMRTALEIAPDDHRILGAMAQLEASRERWPRAIELAERSLATSLDPATLALLANSYRAVGDSTHAAEYDRAIDAALVTQPGPFHRSLSLYLLDQGRHVALVLSRAEEEYQVRRDVYGADVLAWAYHKSGRDADARRMMDVALRLGTADATFFFHAGMIARGVGDAAAARAYLERALAINPRFHPSQPAEARAALGALARLRVEIRALAAGS